MKENMKPKEIHEDILQILAEGSLSSVTGKKWTVESLDDRRFTV